MKIVRVSNFDNPTVPQALVAENISNEDELRIMLTALQRLCTSSGTYWYSAFPDDYQPTRGMSDLA